MAYKTDFTDAVDQFRERVEQRGKILQKARANILQSANERLSGGRTPPQPSGLTLEQVVSGFDATWNDVVIQDLLRYELEVATDAGFSNIVESVRSRDPLAEIRNLTAGTTHYARVRSVSQAGNKSPWSASVSTTPGVLSGSDVAAGAVTQDKIAKPAVGTPELIDDAVTDKKQGTAVTNVTVDNADGTKVVVTTGQFTANATGEPYLINATLILDADGSTGTSCTVFIRRNESTSGVTVLKQFSLSIAHDFQQVAHLSWLDEGATSGEKMTYEIAIDWVADDDVLVQTGWIHAIELKK